MKITPQDSLQEAFDKARPGETIELAEGIYRTKCKLSVPGVTLRGAGIDKTVIVYDDYANKIAVDGKEYNTFRTWTLAVVSDGVTIEDMTIQNDALHPEIKGQEVALTVYGDAFTMRHCRLVSTQDTLFAGPLPDDLIERYDGFLTDDLRQCKRCRQVYTDCKIEGTVDFIFGCAEALFENCEIRSLNDARHVGYAAAPAHALSQTEGFTFRKCIFTYEEGVDAGSIYLARPWRDYGLCVFEDCTYGAHIHPLGFDKWNDTNRDRTARFIEIPPVPGRVKWVRTR
ncbi:MAG: hypothetical protein IKS37_07200 [Solobacterium sp.]|nr:hypothetical protein [Solobacterium sp.]